MNANRREWTRFVWAATTVLAMALVGCHGEVADNGGNKDSGGSGNVDLKPPPACPGGTDSDGDGYGPGCPAGEDCDDSDPTRNAGATEVCDGKDNDCDGKVDEDLSNCNAESMGSGNTPFPTDKTKDPNLQDSTGVKLDGKGDLVLGTSEYTFRYLWIANTDDLSYGTVSKVDSKTVKEVGRFYTVTCHSKPGVTACLDANGKTIKKAHLHKPSRTAVDFNMDVWVANRCRDGGQQSVTKIAADPLDCIDRNNNGKIDTSKDQNGDGKITVDCNSDGKPDDITTTCTGAFAGKPPEFIGYEDECVLFTVNYGDANDIGRSVCLDGGKSMIGASNAWVGTYKRPENKRGNNKYYKINGNTGAIDAEVTLSSPEHHAYGCTADGHQRIWSTDIGHHMHDHPGSLTYFEAVSPYRVGTVLRGPTKASPWKGHNGKYRHYGIATDANGHIWLGGLESGWVLRYKPNRASFDTLDKGTWTRIDVPKGFYTRGVGPDLRGKVWVAIHQGYVMRVDQNVPDGVHDKTNAKLNTDYWKMGGTTVIGAGVDFDGNIWGVAQTGDVACRLDADAQGNVKSPPTATTKMAKVGKHPYTYSDFTGYGLANFVRPSGQWSYLHKLCGPDKKATWKQVTWNATTPPGTQVTLRVRTGDTLTTLGSWSKEFTKSPAEIGPGAANPVSPNPSTLMQVEFTMISKDKQYSPTLHDYAISYTCLGGVD